MSIANYLTFIRVLLGPIFLFVYLDYTVFHLTLISLPYILLFLLGIAELSDLFDGYIARKYNQVTDLGKILDPMADSIYRISVFLTFTLPPVQLPMILIFIFLYRDSIISTLRTICALKGFALSARPSGKLKAVMQALTSLTIILLLIPYSLGYLSQDMLNTISTLIVAVTALYSLISGIEYLYVNRQYVASLLLTKNKSP